MQAGIELYIDNRHVYGYIPPPLSSDSGKEDAQLRQTLLELQLEALIEGRPFPVASTLQAYIEPVHEGEDERLGVDAVYVINLRRRPERRRRMQATLALLNIKATFWDATDGKVLSEEYLERHRISSLEGYLDPYHQRPMTFGEIGCFLSHYRIWEEAKRKNYSAVSDFDALHSFHNLIPFPPRSSSSRTTSALSATFAPSGPPPGPVLRSCNRKKELSTTFCTSVGS